MTDGEHGEHGEVDYDVVMPFIACESQGGPFPDDAFVAGFRCGAVDAMLNLTRAALEAGEGLTDDVIQCREPELAQLDLIAMRRGFTMDAEPVDDEWFAITFTRAVGDDD